MSTEKRPPDGADGTADEDITAADRAAMARLTTVAVGGRLRRLRTMRQLTVRALADLAVKRSGVKLSGSGVSEMEFGRRTVSVDQLTALAAALDVSPMALLVPDEAMENGDIVALTGTGDITAERLIAWLRCEMPLEATDLDEFDVVSWQRSTLPLARYWRSGGGNDGW